MQDLTRELAGPSLRSLLRMPDLEVEIEITHPTVALDTDFLRDMISTDGFGIAAEAHHDPALDVELEVLYDATAGWPLTDALEDAWFDASDEVLAATDTVWLPTAEPARTRRPARLALIAGCAVAMIALVAAFA